MKYFLVISNIVLLAGLLILYVLFFRNSSANSTESLIPEKAKTSQIVYINTDTIFNNYTFAKDNKKVFEDFQKQLQDNYAGKANAFQREYNEYIKKGSSGALSLDEQKQTEALLTEKQKNLMALENELTTKLSDKERQLNQGIQDTILAYIERFNRSHHYTYILGYAKGGGILTADKKLDLTQAILKGLNDEYQQYKKSK